MILGIGGNNTSNVLEKIISTDLSFFEAILSVTPYYNKPTQEGLYQHYKAISSRVMKINIVPYNNEWPILFEKIKKEIKKSIDDNEIIIEHVGSTSSNFFSLLLLMNFVVYLQNLFLGLSSFVWLEAC